MENRKGRLNLLFFVIGVIVGLVLVAVGAYYAFNKKEEPKVVEVPLTEEEILDITKDIMELYFVKIPSSVPVIPIQLDNHDQISNYKANSLTSIDKSNIILNYVYLYRDLYCNDNECQIKVNDLEKKVGLKIGSNFNETEYVKAITEIEGEKYYNVVLPTTINQGKTVSGCRNNYVTENKKLEVVCNIVNHGEETSLGKGTFTYTLVNELLFESFTFTKEEQ